MVGTPLADDILHAILPVVRAQLRSLAAGNTMAACLGATVTSASLFLQTHQAVLLVFRAELNIFPTGNTKVRLLGATVVHTPPAVGDIHDAVLLVADAELRIFCYQQHQSKGGKEAWWSRRGNLLGILSTPNHARLKRWKRLLWQNRGWVSLRSSCNNRKQDRGEAE